MGWQWHQLGHMQTIYTSLQTDNHTNTSSLEFLQAGCSSCRPTNSVRALKAINKKKQKTKVIKVLTGARWCFCRRLPWHRAFPVPADWWQLSRVGVLWENQTWHDVTTPVDPIPTPSDCMFDPHHTLPYASCPVPHNPTSDVSKLNCK